MLRFAQHDRAGREQYEFGLRDTRKCKGDVRSDPGRFPISNAAVETSSVYEKARAGAQRQLCDFGKCIEIAHVRYALVPGLTFPQAKPLKLASK